MSRRSLAQCISTTAAGVTIYLDVDGAFDVKNELVRAQRELVESQTRLQKLEDLLGSVFATNAPPEIVECEREKLLALQARCMAITHRRDTLVRISHATP